MSTMADTPALRLRVHSMMRQTQDILTLVLESLDHHPLPEFTPGAHLDIKIAPGLSRSYSIVGYGGAPHRYEIGVAKDPRSRGGSRFVHEKLRVGDEVNASLPRNLFPLNEAAASTVLIAGGIGITPIWSMAQRLEALQRPWTLCYAARSREHAAYLEDIEALARQSRVGSLLTHFDDEHGNRPADIESLLARADNNAHLYCCGPQPMLAAFESATAKWPSEQVHLERFSAAPNTAPAGQFKVILKQSGMCLDVPPERSILDIALEAGVNAQYGCMQGSCGLCETAVLSGIPEHRDNLLSDSVKSQNRTMLICCSRSQSEELVLDL